MKKLLLRITIGAICACSTVLAGDIDSFYTTIFDLEAQIVESEDGEFMIDIDDFLHPLSTLYTDEKGFCYLKVNKKHKNHKSRKDHNDADDSEMACILGCPDCGRAQTCRLVVQNKGKCSKCRQIFPANAYSWKCTNCHTQNYFNPERCGLPTCRCLRELCDPDMKTNLNTKS